MKQLATTLSIFITLVAHSADAKASEWPKLSIRGDIAQCTETLQLAKIMFQSDTFYLCVPPTFPENFGSSIILGPNSVDISSGGALNVDRTIFNKILTYTKGAD
ncbi:MAG: hypothetical protein H7240_13540 [Glaciimonas sp.]|nr:hypothetical protein [Glaciimonas sp.]